MAKRKRKTVTRRKKSKRGKRVRVSKRKQSKRKPKRKKKISPPTKPPQKPPAGEAQSFLVVFSASGYDDVSFEVIATDDVQALDIIKNDILNTENGQKLIRRFKSAVMPFDPPRYRPLSEIGYIGERE